MSVNVYDPVNNELIPVAGATLFAEMPLGAILAFDAEEVPDGWLIFNGQTVLRSDYPDLWARANRNNQVGVGKFYGIGDGSTNFTLADLRETSLKGYGETSRSVGAHVKSGGLGVGEFIDDRIQNHTHDFNLKAESGDVGNWFDTNYAHIASAHTTDNGISAGARSGSTTEVKAVGVVWAVKAKLTGLPVDLVSRVEGMITLSLLRPILLPAGQYRMECTISKEGNNIWGSIIFLPFVIDSNVIITSSLYRPASQSTIMETSPTINTVGNQVYVTTTNSNFDSYVGKDGVFIFNISYT